MQINTIIMRIMLVFLFLGAADRILENRFSIGQEFEKGLMTAGKMLMVMTGMMVLAPLIGTHLSPILTPFFSMLGADPSMFASCFLANDCGGAALAKELANSPEVGLFSGLIVSSMLAPTLTFTIPISLGLVEPYQKPAVIYGIIAGIITIPIGSLLGGLTAGFNLSMMLRNLLPILMFSLTVLVAILIFKERTTPFFIYLGRFFIGISIVGLCLGACVSIGDFVIIEGLAPIEDAFKVVGNIAVVLAGAFPLLCCLRRAASGFFRTMSRLLNINEQSIAGFLACLANSLVTFEMMKKMDTRGLAMNAAFSVSAAFVLGDHLAFTAQYNPQMVAPMIVAKLSAGILAVMLSIPMIHYLLPASSGATSATRLASKG
ncbi:MAG: ethanolamine utilization protein EutH [Candidatus Fimivivens sp.]